MNSRNEERRLLIEAREMMVDLHESGLVDMSTMKKFEMAHLLKPSDLTADKIKKIREDSGVSQPVLAQLMNVSPSAIKQWERGERRPSGASLKLLQLIDQKGIAAIL